MLDGLLQNQWTTCLGIHTKTGGIPRRINNRCRAALLDAYIRDRTIVEEKTIDRVINEFANYIDIAN